MAKDKKDKKNKIEKIKLPDNEEDLAKLLSELDKKDKRVQVIGFTINIVRNPWLNILIYILMNALFITSSFCIFQPVNFNTIWFLPVFIITFTVVDYLLKFIIYRYFQKLILYTVTTIFIVQDIISLALSCLPVIFLFDIGVKNIWLLLGSMLTFLIVRFIMTFLLKRRA